MAFVLIIGEAERFGCGKQVASYLGLVPGEESSGDRQRLGHISKQGNKLVRFLLVEAAQVTVRSDGEWRRKYFHLALRRGRKVAKVDFDCYSDSVGQSPSMPVDGKRSTRAHLLDRGKESAASLVSSAVPTG